MDAQNIKTQIETHITNGDTEAAIQALVEYTKSTNEEQHEDAMMLSGQFKQWKREKMLGVEQSDSELRRIEMGIMAILKGNALGESGSTHQSQMRGSGSGGGSRTMLIIGGIVGILAIAMVAWFIGRDTGRHHPEAGADAEQPSAIIEPAETTVQAPVEQPTVEQPVIAEPAAPADDDGEGATILKAGESMELMRKYFSKNRNFYARFGSDGNLCVYHSNGRFLTGSYQLGKPLNGVIAKMQEDGNFVVYDKADKALWASETHPFFDKRFISPDMKPVRLVLNNDGALALYSASNKLVWTLQGGKI